MAKRLQTYDSPDITVTFDPNICRHTGVCLRTLPPVFDIRRRKWIDTLAAARARGAGTLWLGVWERNPRGIAFYVKCGFRDVGSKPFLLGSDWQTDRVMVRPL